MWLDAQAAFESARRRPFALGIDSILQQLPGLSRDERGRDDSPVNLLLFGPEAAVRAAVLAAGFADASRAPRLDPAVFPPVSDEFLFGRRQDMAFVEDVVRLRSRHHFRLWRAPFRGPGNEEVWLGTASFDVDLAWRWDGPGACATKGFYHRIDPDIDAERDYIRDALLNRGRVPSARLFAHPRGVRSGFDSKCSPYRSDGRILTAFITS